MKFKVALILHSLQLFKYDFVFLQQQDNSHYIENEELNGFLKDLMDLVEEVRNGFEIAVRVKALVTSSRQQLHITSREPIS